MPLDPAAPPDPVPSAPARRRSPAHRWDVEQESRRRLAEATAGAAALLERAGEEARLLRAAAVAEGREEGLAGVTELLARAAAERDRLLAAAEPQLVELAFAIAARVLAGAAERDRQAVVETARRALGAARRRAQVTLRAHPADVAALREVAPQLAAEVARASHLAIVGDAGVERGGVVVETEVGTVDARLPAQLEALRRALEAGAPLAPAGAEELP